MNRQLETNRLYMRPFEAADAEGLFELDRNPNVHRYLGNQSVTSLAQCEEIIASVQRQYAAHGIGRFAVLLKETNTFIGWAGLKFVTEPENNHVDYYDIGYRLQEVHWGKGYASEAALAWRDHAFSVMKVPALYASAHVDNIGSNTILRKIGMVQDGQYEHDGLPCNWYRLNNPYL